MNHQVASPSPEPEIHVDQIASSFRQFANQEYESLIHYCNAIASVSHAVTDANTHYSSLPPETTWIKFPYRNHCDLLESAAYNIIPTSSVRELPNVRTTSRDPIQHGVILNKAMKEYSEAVENLRQCHKALTQFIHTQVNHFNVTRLCHPLIQWMKEHLALSSRVLQTCCTSSTTIGYGPFYQNGLLKDLNGTVSENQSWHDIRTISLAALRASIARFERNIENASGYHDHIQSQSASSK